MQFHRDFWITKWIHINVAVHPGPCQALFSRGCSRLRQSLTKLFSRRAKRSSWQKSSLIAETLHEKRQTRPFKRCSYSHNQLWSAYQSRRANSIRVEFLARMKHERVHPYRVEQRYESNVGSPRAVLVCLSTRQKSTIRKKRMNSVLDHCGLLRKQRERKRERKLRSARVQESSRRVRKKVQSSMCMSILAL